MKYEDIARVNGEMTTLPISKKDKNGNVTTKDYAMVPERVTAFRKLYPEGFIRTEIISHDGNVVLMNAVAGYYKDTGEMVILGSGFAQEVKGQGLVNGTSYIENCETSAVGRALGFLGLGLNGGGICSAEELANAITAQRQMQDMPKPTPATVEKVDRVPALEKKVEQATEISPVKKYLLDAMADMREARGISAADNNKIFRKQTEALVRAKLAPAKKLEEYTMDEAMALVDAMYKCFDPTGTELKVE